MYRDEGFLPEAFRNFLALLGWSPGGDEEFLRTTELIEKFCLSGVSRTNGVFDRAKLEWFNTQYLQKLPIEELLPQVEARTEAQRPVERRVGRGAGHAWFSQTVDLLRPRIRFLPDFSTWSRAFFSDDFAIEEAGKAKFWKDPKVPELLARPRRCAGRPARVESRRLRSRLSRRSRSRRRESRPPDQRHPRRHRRPIRSPAAIRHHGRPGPRPRRKPPPRPSIIPLTPCHGPRRGVPTSRPRSLLLVLITWYSMSSFASRISSRFQPNSIKFNDPLQPTGKSPPVPKTEPHKRLSRHQKSWQLPARFFSCGFTQPARKIGIAINQTIP